MLQYDALRRPEDSSFSCGSSRLASMAFFRAISLLGAVAYAAPPVDLASYALPFVR